jgi:hypothetical protein
VLLLLLSSLGTAAAAAAVGAERLKAGEQTAVPVRN